MDIALPAPVVSASTSLQQAIRDRRTCRSFSAASIEQHELSALLWAAQGMTGSDGARSAPSAGAQYPFQILLAAEKVTDLATGTYRYHPVGHSLELLDFGRIGDKLEQATIDEQPWVGQAAVIVVLVADLQMMREHFHAQVPVGSRGERYVYLEAGAIAQNVHLQATEIGLGAVLVGGFDDAIVRQSLELSDSQQPAALICIGARS